MAGSAFRTHRVMWSMVFVCTIAFAWPVHCMGEKSFLWRVDGKLSTVYLLGPIHLLKNSDYPLNKAIGVAFGKADYLAVEADINDIGSIDLGDLMEKAVYQGEETIKDHLTGDTYSLVEKETGKLGLPLELVSKQKPWFLSLLIPSVVLMNAGYDPNYGVDRYFLNMARGKKQILELESLAFQINLLAGFADKEQELLLLHELRDLEILTKDVDKLVKAWKAGDTKVFEGYQTRTYGNNSGFRPIYDKLIVRRNKNMTTRIEEYLRSRGVYFVIVGAAHMTGDKGIIRLLKEKGFSVEQY